MSHHNLMGAVRGSLRVQSLASCVVCLCERAMLVHDIVDASVQTAELPLRHRFAGLVKAIVARRNTVIVGYVDDRLRCDDHVTPTILL